MDSENLFNVRKMFKKDLIFYNFEAKNNIDVLEKLSDFVYAKGMVKDSFKAAVISREKGFPTGLPTQGIKVAIPHTDSKHVIEPAVVVAKLARPIDFDGMGMEDIKVPVDYVFMLLINNDGHQVFLLQNMMNLCMNEEISERLLNVKNSDEIYDIIQNYYQTYAEE